MKDFGLLILRLTLGGLLAGHGAQKLFGWFGGHGLGGTSGWMESMGLRPGRPWAFLAGLTEFGGGLLTLLGLLNPLGPLGIISSMGMATAKVHWGKPIWVTSGGAELPITNTASALAVALTGPGRISLDHALGLRLPRRLILVPGLLVAAAGIAAGLYTSTHPRLQQQIEQQVQEKVEQATHTMREQAGQAAEQVEPAVRVAESALPVEGLREQVEDLTRRMTGSQPQPQPQPQPPPSAQPQAQS
jgi:putative oxidoreductase